MVRPAELWWRTTPNVPSDQWESLALAGVRPARVTNLRWAVLALAPFILVPIVGLAIMAPSVALSRWRLGGAQRRLTEGEFDFAAAVACATAVAVCALGLWGRVAS